MKILHLVGVLFFLSVCYSCAKDELVQNDEEVAKVNQPQKKKTFEPDTWMAGIEITDLFGSSIYGLMEDVKTNSFAAVGVYVKGKNNPDKPLCWELAMEPLTDNGWSLYVEDYVKRLYLVYSQKIPIEDDEIDVPVFYEEREPMWAKCTFSYYDSLRVFELLQNEDLELYPKR